MCNRIREFVVVADFYDRGDPNIYVSSRERASVKGETDGGEWKITERANS